MLVSVAVITVCPFVAVTVEPVSEITIRCGKIPPFSSAFSHLPLALSYLSTCPFDNDAICVSESPESVVDIVPLTHFCVALSYINTCLFAGVVMTTSPMSLRKATALPLALSIQYVVFVGTTPVHSCLQIYDEPLYTTISSIVYVAVLS